MNGGNLVTCPHCGSQLADDGTLAGQGVICPYCGRQFLMPGSPVKQSEFDFTPPQTMRKQAHRKRANTSFVLVGGFASVTVIAIIAGVVWHFGSSPGGRVAPSTGETVDGETEDPWQMGFNFGYSVARIRRSSEATGLVRAEYDDDYHGKIRLKPPERMKQFRDGYRAGFRKAWEER